MKTKHLALVGCFFGAILQLHAQGYLVPNGVTSQFYGNYFGLHVIQNPTNSDYTGFLLIPQGANAFSFNPFADESVRVFLVSSNDPVSLQPILSQNYTEMPSPSVFEDGIPFYVGLYTGYNPWIITNGTSLYTGIYEDPLFGWAHLVNNAGVIELLDSALEYGGAGIYAGTQTIIPEPSTLALAAIGTMLFGLRRWRDSTR